MAASGIAMEEAKAVPEKEKEKALVTHVRMMHWIGLTEIIAMVEVKAWMERAA